jgi:hypothetical protein
VLLGTGGMTIDVIGALGSGIAQDWGAIGTSVSARADLAPVTAVPGYNINLGAAL